MLHIDGTEAPEARSIQYNSMPKYSITNEVSSSLFSFLTGAGDRKRAYDTALLYVPQFHPFLIS
jgi:hypothetical protein